jgi:hypothetical protein
LEFGRKFEHAHGITQGIGWDHQRDDISIPRVPRQLRLTVATPNNTAVLKRGVFMVLFFAIFHCIAFHLSTFAG